MISLNETGNRFRAVWEITLGDSSKLRLLDISSSGFKTSFQAIPVALVPFFLRWICVIQIMADMPGDFTYSSILIRTVFIDLCQWIIPLMLIIAASGLLGIRDRIIAFVVAYNWSKAFIEWLYVPLIALQLVLPKAYILHWLCNNFLLVISVIILYRLFQAALNKKNSYMLPFIILYSIISIFVFIISLETVGWLPLMITANP